MACFTRVVDGAAEVSQLHYHIPTIEEIGLQKVGTRNNSEM